MKPKTPDEQIAEFKAKESWVEGYKKRHPELNKPNKSFHWYQIPLFFVLGFDFGCLLSIPPLIVICLLRYLGVI